MPPSLAGLEGAGKLNSSPPFPFFPLPFALLDRKFLRGSSSAGVKEDLFLLARPLAPGSGESVNLKIKLLSKLKLPILGRNIYYYDFIALNLMSEKRTATAAGDYFWPFCPNVLPRAVTLVPSNDIKTMFLFLGTILNKEPNRSEI